MEHPQPGPAVTHVSHRDTQKAPRGAKKVHSRTAGRKQGSRTACPVADAEADLPSDTIPPASAEGDAADGTSTSPAPPRGGPSEAEATLLVALYAPLVRRIAGGFQRRLPRNVLRDDLIAAGMSGLWDAIRRQNEHPCSSFEWYVRVRIRGAILDELRAQDWLPRRARAAVSADTQKTKVAPFVVRLDDISEWDQGRCLATGEAASSESAVDAKLESERLAQAVLELPERERHIVSMHYFKGVRFKDLGAELGVSEPRVSQLHSRAMRRLKTMLDDAA